jgi:hypothetical protein
LKLKELHIGNFRAHKKPNKCCSSCIIESARPVGLALVSLQRVKS